MSGFFSLIILHEFRCFLSTEDTNYKVEYIIAKLKIASRTATICVRLENSINLRTSVWFLLGARSNFA